MMSVFRAVLRSQGRWHNAGHVLEAEQKAGLDGDKGEPPSREAWWVLPQQQASSTLNSCWDTLLPSLSESVLT